MSTLLPWLDLPVVPQSITEARLTLREAKPFIGQSHSVIADDCRFLGIPVYPNKGGFLTRQNVWELSVLVFWKKWKRYQRSNWRGDRDDLWKDFTGEHQLLSFVASQGLTREKFDNRYDAYLEKLGKSSSRSLSHAA